jgi:penicillin amidase
MCAIQGDLVSLQALQLIAALRPSLEILREEPLKSAAELMLHWNGHCGADSVGAALFHVFQHHLIKTLLMPTLGEELFVAYVEIFNQSIAPMERILCRPGSPWLAGRSIDALTRSALANACTELIGCFGPKMSRWRWGKLHTLRLNHAFHRVNFLRPLFSLGPFAAGGDNFTVNLGFYRHSNPYALSVGPSMRMVVELGARLQSKFILPSGQSGHIFSRHFRDQTARWRDQGYITLSADDVEPAAMRRLLLKPVAG